MTLSPAQQKFVLHWGEMGARWGINRTVAQIHALLFLSPRPLDAEEICETLDVARSNVSTSLRELQSWEIVRVVHVLGDRRDRFETVEDVWELFRRILEARKRREIDPTLTVLRECLVVAESEGGEDPHVVGQIRRMQEFFAQCDRWYGHMARLPRASLQRFVRMGSKIPKWLDTKTG